MTETNKNMKNKKYPERIFLAECNYFGFIEGLVSWKDCEYEDTDGTISVVTPFAIKFSEAVNDLHEWLLTENGRWAIKEYPKAKFNIYAVNGSQDKHGSIYHDRVYSISSRKAKKLLF